MTPDTDVSIEELADEIAEVVTPASHEGVA
jgi:hypothetical protein